MDVLPVDLTQVVAVTLGCLVALIPLFGIALRFAAAPLADALVAARGDRARPEQLAELRGRIEALERQLGSGPAAGSASRRAGSLPAPAEPYRLR